MGPDTDTRLRVECVVPGREPASARKEERGEFVPRGDAIREMFTKRMLSCELGRDASFTMLLGVRDDNWCFSS